MRAREWMVRWMRAKKKKILCTRAQTHLRARRGVAREVAAAHGDGGEGRGRTTAERTEEHLSLVRKGPREHLWEGKVSKEGGERRASLPNPPSRPFPPNSITAARRPGYGAPPLPSLPVPQALRPCGAVLGAGFPPKPLVRPVGWH